jgi:hypothetical protein
MNAIVIALLIVLIGFAAVATVMIGNSKQNKEGNPDYEKKTGANTLRLTIYYAAASVVSCIALVWYITG